MADKGNAAGEAVRYLGVVCRVFPKGFGFIEPQGMDGEAIDPKKQGVYFHVSDLKERVGDFAAAVPPGTKVEFSLVDGGKGPRAVGVVVVRGAAAGAVPRERKGKYGRR